MVRCETGIDHVGGTVGDVAPHDADWWRTGVSRVVDFRCSCPIRHELMSLSSWAVRFTDLRQLSNVDPPVPAVRGRPRLLAVGQPLACRGSRACYSGGLAILSR